MAARRRRLLPAPTDAELRILRVLWQRGASTVRDVHESLAAERDTGYTTVLKLMQIMAEKGLVHRDESARQHVYVAAASEVDTQRQIVDGLLQRAFEGSAKNLVLHALATQRVSRDELAEIRALLDEIERSKALLDAIERSKEAK